MKHRITFTDEEKALYAGSGETIDYTFYDDKQMVEGKGISTGRDLIKISYETVQEQIKQQLENLNSEIRCDS